MTLGTPALPPSAGRTLPVPGVVAGSGRASGPGPRPGGGVARARAPRTRMVPGGQASERASERAADGRAEVRKGGGSAAAGGRTLSVPGVARACRARTGSGGAGGPAIPTAPAEGGSAGGLGVTWPRRGRRSIQQAAIQRESVSGRAGERKSERAGGGWEGGRAGGRRERGRARAYAAGSGRRGWVRPSERAGPVTSARGWFWAGERASERA